MFLPVGSATYDFYGGDRKGDEPVRELLVALDAATGRRALALPDRPPRPVGFRPARAARAGHRPPRRPRRARGRAGDQVGVRVRARPVTGEPLFGVEERPVPQSRVPGEATSPTQPIPRRPPPLVRHAITRADLSTVTPESHRQCAALVRRGRARAALFTPPDAELTLTFPGTLGGATWSGAAFDPAARRLYVNVNEVGAVGPDGQDAGGRAAPLPASEPVGRIRAVLGRATAGPASSRPGARSTRSTSTRAPSPGRCRSAWWTRSSSGGCRRRATPSLGGAIATAGGLVFIAGTNDRRFRAFDARTGRELWVDRLEANGHATPMTYRGRDGRQYVVIAAGGGGYFSPDDGGRRGGLRAALTVTRRRRRPCRLQVVAARLPVSTRSARCSPIAGLAAAISSIARLIAFRTAVRARSGAFANERVRPPRPVARASSRVSALELLLLLAVGDVPARRSRIRSRSAASAFRSSTGSSPRSTRSVAPWTTRASAGRPRSGAVSELGEVTHADAVGHDGGLVFQHHAPHAARSGRHQGRAPIRAAAAATARSPRPRASARPARSSRSPRRRRSRPAAGPARAGRRRSRRAGAAPGPARPAPGSPPDGGRSPRWRRPRRRSARWPGRACRSRARPAPSARCAEPKHTTPSAPMHGQVGVGEQRVVDRLGVVGVAELGGQLRQREQARQPGAGSGDRAGAVARAAAGAARGRPAACPRAARTGPPRRRTPARSARSGWARRRWWR